MKVFLTILVLGISAYEITGMARRRQKKEIVLFIVIALLSLALGYFYISNPYMESLADYILKFYGQDF